MSVGGEQWSWGAVPTGDGATRFRLWAPGQRRLYLKSEKTGAPLAMHAVGDGWFERVTDAVKTGAGYRFVLESGEAVPDPASRAQFGDVHGASVLVDHDSYVWAETRWRGRPWHEADRRTRTRQRSCCRWFRTGVWFPGTDGLRRRRGTPIEMS